MRELKEATGLPAAASFKHVSPAGAALGLPLDEVDKRVYFVAPDAALSPIACAYIRARGADRLCSYGDWAALSDECDAATAAYLKNEVSDGIIAPDYTDEALDILKTKHKGGSTTSCRSTPPMSPRRWSRRMFSASPSSRGTTTAKSMKACSPTSSPTTRTCPRVPSATCILALITLKYTQSNSVCYVKDGSDHRRGRGPAEPHPLHPSGGAARRTTGISASHPKVLALPFVDGIRRPDRDNAIDVYLSDECDDVLADGAWQHIFTGAPRGAHAARKSALGSRSSAA